MFDSVEDATAILADWLQPAQIAQVVPMLQPTAFLLRVPGQDEVGASRIGGTPDVPAGFVWPAIDGDSLARDALSQGTDQTQIAMRQHLEAAVPMSFIAQLDLAAAATVPELADLPDQGRLLIFYDFVIGPYQSDAAVGRVIWDQTPATALVRIDLPPALVAASERWRAEYTEAAKAYGLDDAEAPEWTHFDVPPSGAGIEAALTLPSPYALDPDTTPADLVGAAKGDPVSDAARDFFSLYEDAYYTLGDQDDPPPIRLLGVAQPVQDDPRLDAVIFEEFDGIRPTSEEWAARYPDLSARTADWRLLMQIDLPSWLQDNGEGVVYLLIRNDDLAAQQFDSVVFVYQQT